MAYNSSSEFRRGGEFRGAAGLFAHLFVRRRPRSDDRGGTPSTRVDLQSAGKATVAALIVAAQQSAQAVAPSALPRSRWQVWPRSWRGPPH
jgi:hypothetical protein